MLVIVVMKKRSCYILSKVTLGATSIERHITLDRTMYGSDQCISSRIGFRRS